MKTNYFFDNDERFVIENYNVTKPFASFLPGIAGKLGIPMWVFFVNRGQGIASFGIQDKNKPIMEFFPANKCYQLVPFRGFRTFVKIKTDREITFYEPFSSSIHQERIQKIKISSDSFELEEFSQKYGLQFNIIYFTIPNEDFAALARRISIKNNSSQSIDFEILDGLPVVIPFGANDFALKMINYTLESWMRVENLNNNVPFYKMAQLAGDEPTIDEVNAGNFYLTFIQQNESSSLLKPIIDPFIVFKQNTTFNFPDGFLKHSLNEIYLQRQINTNKTPCGFFGTNIVLKPEQEIELFAIIGHATNVDWLNKNVDRIATKNFFDSKYEENKRIVSILTENINTKTSSTAFDLYCRQTYLDNLLRGGYPFMIKKNDVEPVLFHMYIRKHGDLERDYNFFSLEPTYYSQGNGNYRDVNQNRRCEVQMDPRVRHANILTFMNLIQTDGYNPLEIRGSLFKLGEEKVGELLRFVDKKEKLRNFLAQPFTPGKLIRYLKISEIKLSIPLTDFLTKILISSKQFIEAVFGEGYWVDHWTYNLDL
ncbi:MAG: cellobiose phosphorylase, partial [Promethearchaeota archaeon]